MYLGWEEEEVALYKSKIFHLVGGFKDWFLIFDTFSDPNSLEQNRMSFFSRYAERQLWMSSCVVVVVGGANRDTFSLQHHRHGAMWGLAQHLDIMITLHWTPYFGANITFKSFIPQC